jgi:hypothetical protein
MAAIADFAVVLFEFDGDCCGSVRSFLVRNWCGIGSAVGM